MLDLMTILHFRFAAALVEISVAKKLFYLMLHLMTILHFRFAAVDLAARLTVLRFLCLPRRSELASRTVGDDEEPPHEDEAGSHDGDGHLQQPAGGSLGPVDLELVFPLKCKRKSWFGITSLFLKKIVPLSDTAWPFPHPRSSARTARFLDLPSALAAPGSSGRR